MTYIVPILLFVSLGAIAALHALWAMGKTWPAPDAATLSTYVIGDPKRPGMPPPNAIWLASAAIGFAAIDGLALGFPFGETGDRVAAWIGAGLLAVFACRGIAGYTPFWRKNHSGEVFTLLDKRFYSPFCILIAEGFFTLVSERL